MTTAELILLAAGGVAFLLVLIIALRLQAFVALLITSIVVAVIGGVPLSEVAGVVQEGMGSTLGYIAIIVGIGAMFGEMLQISGGAERIAQTLLRKFGQDRASWALALTGVIIATPVFFEVGLILLIPLVYSLGRSTGRSLLYFGIPMAAGMAVGHAFIPPTPGPVAVAALLGADLGWVILFGFITGIPAAIIGGLLFGRFIGKRIHLGIPDHLAAQTPLDEDSISKLPSFGLVVALLLIPIALILANTASNAALAEGSTLRTWSNFVGHPIMALIIGALLSFYFLGIRRGYTREQVQQIASKSLEPIGIVILVIGAGGVFGHVLIETGIGRALADVMSESNLPTMLLAFTIAMLVRISQGSATVSMITAAGLMAPILDVMDPSQPYLALVTMAIAAGGTTVSHVNDAGFWLVSRLFGMTTDQTLRSWTAMTGVVGLTGLLTAWLISFFV